MKAPAVIVICLGLAGCGRSAVSKKDAAVSPARTLPLVAILAGPERFHGKQVEVTGLYRLGFEISGLFPSRGMSYSEANGVWLRFNNKAVIEPAHFFDLPHPAILECWVQVEGVVDASSHGHSGAWTAEILVRRMKVYPIKWLEDRTNGPDQPPSRTPVGEGRAGGD